MASKHKYEDKTCVVCLSCLRHPRLLPCKHSFCHDCLCGVVKEFVGKSDFPCPMCRASTSTQGPITVENTDKLVTQYRVYDSQPCKACSMENKHVDATVYCLDCDEHMCEVCGETHKKYKLNRTHQIRLSEEAPSPNVRNLLHEVHRCHTHANDIVEYICHDHDVPCCSKCVITSHRKCDKVMLISDVIKDSKTYEASVKERTETIDKALERVSALCITLDGEPSRIATTTDKMEKQMTEITSQITLALEQLRINARAAFTAFNEEKTNILKSTEESLRIATANMTDILKKKEELEGVLSHGDDVQKYLYMRNQPSSGDANAAWKMAFTQEGIVLETKMTRTKTFFTQLCYITNTLKS